MFSGPTGVGKTTLGRILSKAILCDNPSNGEPCGKCESCVLFQEEKHFGYKELDAATFGGKDDMIRLRDDAAFQSVTKKKIILLDESQDISKQGQDSLLKQLEQCPDHLIYIFCTTDPDKMAETLLKRCIQFQVKKVRAEDIVPRLKKICENENIQFEMEALQSIAVSSEGHVRDALHTLEEISYLGPVSVENLRKVVIDYDEDVFSIISNLGSNLNAALEACKKVSSHISTLELYNRILSMLSDASKIIYGYEDFSPSRRSFLIRLKDIHGFSLLEFLDYMIGRDKFVDKIGLQSDIVLLHYKFCAKNFTPKNPIKIDPSPVPQAVPQSLKEEEKPQNAEDGGPVTFAQLSKLSIKERSAFLREKRKNQKINTQEEPEKIPEDWPLPKEDRQGDNSFEDDEQLSPNEFSKNLVGGIDGNL